MPQFNADTPQAQTHDPHHNYFAGVILDPDKVLDNPAGGGYSVLCDGVWYDCHKPNGVNLTAYGIRWKLSTHEIAGRGLALPQG